MKSIKWMSKHRFLNGIRKEKLYVIQPEGFFSPKDAKMYANSSDPFMDWCKHLGVGIFVLMK